MYLPPFLLVFLELHLFFIDFLDFPALLDSCLP
jgi:hypothetical protein